MTNVVIRSFPGQVSSLCGQRLGGQLQADRDPVFQGKSYLATQVCAHRPF